MKIETKFDIGQEVYCIIGHNLQIHNAKIIAVFVNLFEDKEIERLKKNMEFDTAYYVKEFVNVRKQVCDMARKKIVEATCYDTEEEVRNVIYDLNASTALEILDQIEGDANGK